MASPNRLELIDAVTDTPRPYPQLTAAQKDRICYQVRLYPAATAWIRAGHQARAFAYQAEQLELFEDGREEP